jgi:CBS domain containing-hemolysin-like protein
MTLFVTSIALVLVLSAFCSVSEAAIYAVRRPYILTLVKSGSLPGKVLAQFKENMERPISAILILNTAANTAGAAIAGYQAQALFGTPVLIGFTISITLAVLIFSEILPKVVGVAYSHKVALAVALPWAFAIRLLYPLIWLVERLTGLFEPEEAQLSAPEEEVEQLAMLSAHEGSILPLEAQLVRNALRLDDVKASDILTPRSVVFKLSADMTIGDARHSVKEWSVSRIPVYAGKDPENWVGIVLARDILTYMAQDQFDTRLQSLMRPLYFVPETAKGHDLLGEFLKKRSHLFGVLDEYGGIEGVVSLEDVLESLIGQEIVDESDTAADLQEHARRRYQRAMWKRQDQLPKPPAQDGPTT